MITKRAQRFAHRFIPAADPEVETARLAMITAGKAAGRAAALSVLAEMEYQRCLIAYTNARRRAAARDAALGGGATQ